MPGVDIVRGEIDINGVFTDISEIIKTDVHSISTADETNSNVKTIETLKNGYVVIQKMTLVHIINIVQYLIKITISFYLISIIRLNNSIMECIW